MSAYTGEIPRDLVFGDESTEGQLLIDLHTVILQRPGVPNVQEWHEPLEDDSRENPRTRVMLWVNARHESTVRTRHVLQARSCPSRTLEVLVVG